LAQALAEPLVAEPGNKIEYSDIGFILLGEIVERVSGKTLDQFARERIFAPLGMGDAQFNPPKSLRARIAPTENDTTFRKRLVHGEVHDQNAWAMGGVAGDAGLFSTAADLATFCQMLLNGGQYAHQRLLSRSTIAQFTKAVKVGEMSRTLGWDVPSEQSQSGKYFSAKSYGHLGYTGTSIWIDPEKELFVILLTNRVHPSAENEKIKDVRPAVHDALLEALGLKP
jgi:CubicO group peptidase (beta-lactamase class C family)